MKPTDWHVDVTVMFGLAVIGTIGAMSAWHGDAAGSTVAGAAVGGIAGWLTKGAVAPKVTTTTEGEPPVTTTTEPQS